MADPTKDAIAQRRQAAGAAQQTAQAQNQPPSSPGDALKRIGGLVTQVVTLLTSIGRPLSTLAPDASQDLGKVIPILTQVKTKIDQAASQPTAPAAAAAPAPPPAATAAPPPQPAAA